MKHFISLGAGVQSSTMALMASHGEITPMPDGAVFADTQREPRGVYHWLDWLESRLAFPVYRVTHGDLGLDALRVRHSQAGNYYVRHTIPAYIQGPNGPLGTLIRQCTRDHKIDMIYRQYNKLRNKQPVVQWIGISIDESHRMKDSRKPWAKNRYPLVDLAMSRTGCLQWMKDHGYPEPPRSACEFCPYHSDAEWIRLKLKEPDAFERAVKFEKDYQSALSKTTNFRGVAYLHRSRVPLDQVDFRPEDEKTGQMSLFGEECEGMCGV